MAQLQHLMSKNLFKNRMKRQVSYTQVYTHESYISFMYQKHFLITTSSEQSIWASLPSELLVNQESTTRLTAALSQTPH